MGDVKSLLIFAILGPEDKAEFLEFVYRGVPISSSRKDEVAEDQKNQARRSGDFSYTAIMEGPALLVMEWMELLRSQCRRRTRC